MDQKNILPRGIAKPIEQQPDGTWIVRHHFRVVGTSENNFCQFGISRETYLATDSKKY